MKNKTRYFVPLNKINWGTQGKYVLYYFIKSDLSPIIYCKLNNGDVLPSKRFDPPSHFDLTAIETLKEVEATELVLII